MLPPQLSVIIVVKLLCACRPACAVMKQAPNKLLLTLPHRCLVKERILFILFCMSTLYRSNKVLLERPRVSLVHSSHTSHVFSRCAPQLLSQSPSPTISVSIVTILKYRLVCLFVCCMAAKAGERSDHRRLLPRPVPHRTRAGDFRAERCGGVPGLPNPTRERTLRSGTRVPPRQG